MNTTVEIINKLKEASLYQLAVRKGIIPLDVSRKYDIYNYFQVRLVVNKSCSNTIVKSEDETAIKFGCSESTVQRAVIYMKG